MADVTIIPVTNIQNVPAVGQQAQSATEGKSPLPAFAPGSVVDGTIVGKDAQGNFLLRTTNQLILTLQSSTPLTYNSDVTIRIGATANGNSKAQIVSVNGEPFAEYAAQDPVESDSISTSLLSRSTSTPASFTGVVTSTPDSPTSHSQLVSTGQAVLIQLPATNTTPEQVQVPTQTLTNQPTLSTSSEINTTTTNVAASQPATQPNHPSSTASALPNTTPLAEQLASQSTLPTESAANTSVTNSQANIASIPLQTTTPTTSLQPAINNSPTATNTQTLQTPVSTSPQYAAYAKQVTSNSAISSSPANATNNAQPALTSSRSVPTSTTTNTPYGTNTQPTPVITAQVISSQSNGSLLVNTSQGVISIQVEPSSLPVLTTGSTLLITLANQTPQPLIQTENTQTSVPASVSELAYSWDSLKTILSLLVPDSRNSPTTTNTSQLIPRLGVDFVSSSNLLLHLINQRDIQKLVGQDNVDQLKAEGHGELLQKLSSEMTNLQSINTPSDKNTSYWQMMLLPFMFQEELQQARLYVKRDGEKKQKKSEKDKDNVRFVVEVTLSELGAVQMDGLVRKHEQSTSFDLIIRSHSGFSANEQAEITSLYHNAAELTGFKGSLAFQVSADFPVKPLEELIADYHSNKILA